MIKVVEMYYKQGLSQVEIGQQLNVSRTTVSRVLTRARKEGYVEIKINYPEGTVVSKEKRLEKKFHLKEASIAYSQPGEKIEDEVGFYAADYLLRILRNHMTIAMCRGNTLFKMVSCLSNDMRLKFMKLKDINVVTLMAATNLPVDATREERLIYSNFLIDEVGRILNGRTYHLLAPQYVENAEMKQHFMSEKSVKETLNIAMHADAAIMGIGSVDEHSAMVRSGLLDEKQFEDLHIKGGVGELLSHIIDRNGDLIQDDFENRVISLDLDDLMKIPIRVGVACGMNKKDSILSVLKKEYINVLITDDEVADYLLSVE
ncbi:MAG: helix-turn-helix domain-containing protein [Hespellia sp.]|nr:helix-turn-helix domain-containing protein [Hespellia sp.]